MKPYFAKYLPVEGKIKEGDKILSNGVVCTALKKEGEKGTWKTDGFPSYVSNIRKVKLFLCSRDIQVGDKFWDETENKEFICIHISGEGDLENTWFCKDDSHYVAKAAAFKVMGEISPNAIWIKEGDEFDKDEIQPVFSKEATNSNEVDDWTEVEYRTVLIYYKVKGPCGHFH